MSLPFIFFAFANSTSEYLPSLKKETRGLLEIMLRLREDLGLIEYDHRADITTDQVYDIITRTGEKITLLHFSGHADSLHVQLDNATYNIAKFAKLIGGLNNIKLVFLNGCSSKGMVEYFLEAGVKAVIATSEEIDDYQASEFSVAFYKAFAVKSKSLKMAFNQALSNLPAPPTEADSIISRATFKRKNKSKPAKSVPPWGLYYREENPEILNWALVDQSVADVAGLESNPKVAQLRTEIDALKREIDKLATTAQEHHTVIDALKGASPNHPLIAGYQQKIKDIEAEVEQIEAEIEEKYGHIVQANRAQDKLYLGDTLRFALDRLNYGEQLDYFEEKFTGIDSFLSGAFIVQGSPLCGQEMLKKRLIDILGIRNELTEIIIDFSSLSASAPSQTGIWSRFYEELCQLLKQPVADSSPAPDEIVQLVYDRFLDNAFPKPIILVFNNIHTFSGQTNVQIIKEFWFKFIDQLKKVKGTAKSFPTHILLFVIDRNSKIKMKDDCCIGDKEEDFLNAFEPAKLEEYQTHIFPIIQPVYTRTLKNWRRSLQLPFDLGLTPGILTEIAGDKGSFILPSIKEICEKAGYKHIYQEYYQAYEFKIPEL